MNVAAASANNPPTITSNLTPGVSENTTPVVTVTASDGDGDTPAFAITGGADALVREGIQNALDASLDGQVAKVSIRISGKAAAISIKPQIDASLDIKIVQNGKMMAVDGGLRNYFYLVWYPQAAGTASVRILMSASAKAMD